MDNEPIRPFEQITVYRPAGDVTTDEPRAALDRMRGFEILTDDELAACNTIVAEAKTRWSVLEEMRKTVKGPVDRLAATVQGWFKPGQDYYSEVERIGKSKIAAYLTKREAEQRALQDEANRKAAEERKRLEQRATKAEQRGDIDKAEALGQQALAIVAPRVASAPPKLTGTSTREVWKFEVTDPALVPPEYCCPDLDKLGRIVKALRSETNITGVRVWAEKQIATRKAGV